MPRWLQMLMKWVAFCAEGEKITPSFPIKPTGTPGRDEWTKYQETKHTANNKLTLAKANRSP